MSTQTGVEVGKEPEGRSLGRTLAEKPAAILLIAPSAHHRIEFRQRDKKHLVFVANRMAIGGLAFLALAMLGVVLLISHVLYGTTATAVVTGVAAVLFGWLWYGAPLLRRMRAEPDDA